MPKLIVACFLALSFSLVARAQIPDSITGFYRITGKSRDGSTHEYMIAFVRKKGTAIELFDLNNNRKLEGKADEDEMRFTMPEPTEGRHGGAYLTLYRSWDGTKLVGDEYDYDRLGSRPGGLRLEAIRLPSVWACSNHTDPVHTAESENQMRELTKQKGCKGWHRLKESDMK